MTTELPLEIKDVTEEEDKILKKYYKGYRRAMVRVGPRGYLQPPGYAARADDIRRLHVREDDVWVVSFSRSGTTWLQELTWLVANDLDYEGARQPLSRRYAYIEYPCHESDVPRPAAGSGGGGGGGVARATEHDYASAPGLPSPRFLKTHLPLSLLPAGLLRARVLYVARDVRDVAVSFFFMHKLFRYFHDDVTFKEFWELFKKDLLFHMPIFPHVEEAWQQRHHPNMVFLFYEQMQNDLRGAIDQVCKLFNKEYTTEQKDALAQHLSFENMKKTHQFSTRKDEDTEIKFMRKGKSGGWVDYFDDQMKKEAEEYIQKHLRESDLRFPHVSF